MEEKYVQVAFEAEDSEKSLNAVENETVHESEALGAVTLADDVKTEESEPMTEISETSEADSKMKNEGSESTDPIEKNTADVSESIEASAEEPSGDGSGNGKKEKRTRRRAATEDGERSDGSESAIAPEKMPRAQAMRVLEAIMFANGDEVYYDQFAKIIGYTTKEAKKIVDAYAKMYDSGSMPRGIRFVKYDKCCQLTTAPDLGEYVTQMIGIRGEPQLSAAAMETLAIVAYNQPVTRAYIEQVRRVDSTRPITVLLDRELIEEKGRLEVIGRPRLFGTTQNFLKTFGITSLDALPSLDLFAVDG